MPIYKTVSIQIRITPQEKDNWKESAEAEGLTLSDWIRKAVDNIDS